MLAWARFGAGRAARLPDGLRSLPGPAVIGGVRCSASPVGPYLEFAVGEPARIGPRPGLCVTTMVVSEPAAKVGNRLNWGIPAELGDLRWAGEEGMTAIVWEDRSISLEARTVGPPLPAWVPLRSVQRRSDGPVLVPRRMTAIVRFARVRVSVPTGDPLSALAGEHPGAVLRSVRLTVDAARSPRGLLTSLRAPSQAPEAARREAFPR